MVSHKQLKKTSNLEYGIKKCQLNNDSLISYNIEMLEMMKQGYAEMGEINLKCAEEASIVDFQDSAYYEMWLCGV